jgi:histidyl-tRNA synthetase
MIAKIKGTVDILPNETLRWQSLEDLTRRVSKLFDFQEIRTPIFEATELFHRGVGDGTDIVKKETYDFMDRGERSVTLRPEGTASVVRSVIENKLYTEASLPLKYYYIGPMFRYERPQKGRQRQFHQYGAEALGSFSPSVDAEIISLAVTYLKALRIDNVKVKINSLGDKESKAAYRQVLLDYLQPKKDQLCGDCQHRYLGNPLRVLDCKVDHDNPVLVEAPKPVDHLNEASKTHFNLVLQYLDGMQIPYEIDKNLVRGLDYYTHTVFELIADDPNLGANTTLGGGGRYNDLFRSLDGPDFPAVGFAFGLERLILAMKHEEDADEGLHCFAIAIGDEARIHAAKIVRTLRHGGLIADYDLLDRPLKGQFKQAERRKAMFLLFLGDDEIKQGVVGVKNARTGDQSNVSLKTLYPTLVEKIRAEVRSCDGNCEDGCSGDCDHPHE